MVMFTKCFNSKRNKIMAIEKKQLSPDEIDRMERFQMSIDLAKKSMDETYEKHLEDCKFIIDLCDKYYDLIWDNNDNFKCLKSKLSEISLTLWDTSFLIISAKYKTSRILLRKWLELVVCSIYFDTIEKEDKNKKMWIDVDDMGHTSFYKKLKKVSDDADSINAIYKELSLYVHNEGKPSYFRDGFYDIKEFNDIYSEINRIQSKMEKMIEKNYKGEVRFKDVYLTSAK